jgi:hypothetical protein
VGLNEDEGIYSSAWTPEESAYRASTSGGRWTVIWSSTGDLPVPVRNGVTIRAVGVAEKGGDVGGPGVIESAFGLLELLRALGRARLAELTKESGLPRATVHRLMGQLAAVGAVERIGAYYRLGSNLLSLGQHVTPLERLRAGCRPACPSPSRMAVRSTG